MSRFIGCLVRGFLIGFIFLLPLIAMIATHYSSTPDVDAVPVDNIMYEF